METARQITNADYVVAIISGPFVQRGSCAIADKYSRAKSALLCGADLVLELPVLYATSSAEFFAKGAVMTLDKLGIVSHLAFGSETDDLQSMKQLAQILSEEPEIYRKTLTAGLSSGLAFPKAREQALKNCCPDLCTSFSIEKPNTILGIEYCKALYQCNSRINPVLIQRIGGEYHQITQDVLFSSASSIRNQLSHNISSFTDLRSQLPDASYQILKEHCEQSFPVFDEDLSALVRFALLTVQNHDYTPYLDVSTDLSNRIRKQLFAYESFHQFAALLKTKELTYSRICRCLLHILLGITDEHMMLAKSVDYVPYFRILGMKASASRLLGEIKKYSDIPIITNPADFPDSAPKLSTASQKLLELDCSAAHIWNGIAGEKFGHATECEYTRRFFKI